MAQIILRNLKNDIRDQLKELAAKNGRSMEEEVRAILREAVVRVSLGPEGKLGFRITARSKTAALEPGEIDEQKGQPARPAEIKP